MTRRRRAASRSLVVTSMLMRTLLLLSTAAGCGLNGTIENPDLDLTIEQAKSDFERMREDPRPLERPLVVLGGYRAWPHLANAAAARLASLTSGRDQDVLPISYTLHSQIESAAALAIRQVEERWPSDDPAETTEVDVVAISMGGLVARTAALPLGELPRVQEPRRKRLKIRRLMTMASPHNGAVLADLIAPDRAARDMKPGSWFIKELNAAFERRDYELVAYAHLHDRWVGATNTAPPGMDPIWADGLPLFSHLLITRDPRLMADVARRLRGETPLGSPSPPPRD